VAFYFEPAVQRDDSSFPWRSNGSHFSVFRRSARARGKPPGRPRRRPSPGPDRPRFHRIAAWARSKGTCLAPTPAFPIRLCVRGGLTASTQAGNHAELVPAPLRSRTRTMHCCQPPGVVHPPFRRLFFVGRLTGAPGRGTGAGCRHAPGDPVVRLRCRLAPNLTSCNPLPYGAPCAAS
jgi:hypothetical protein